MRHDEWDLQIEIVKALKNSGWIVLHIPNERNNGVADSRRMKAGGVVKGAPDLICIGHYRTVVFLELKTKDGKMSIEQRAVKSALEARGFEHRVVRSIDDISDLLL